MSKKRYLRVKSMAEFLSNIGSFFSNLISSPWLLLLDILDIAILALMIYYVLKFIKDTRAAQLLKGIVLLIALLYISQLLKLTGTHFILNKTIEYGMLAMLIVFQPELRSVLENIGRKGLNISKIKKDRMLNFDESDHAVDQLCDAVDRLSKTKTGALIVIERETKLGEIIKTGISLDCSVVPELLCNIFYNKAPLHDGAVIIRDFKIHAAGCFLPLTTRSIGNDLGTRHRAAIGISEVSDAIVVVVSEETGIISVACEGDLKRDFTADTLRAKLKKELLSSHEELNEKEKIEKKRRKSK